MKHLSFLFLLICALCCAQLVGSTSLAFSQRKCSDLVLKFFNQGKETNSKDSEPDFSIIPAMARHPDYSENKSYEFKRAELVLVRGLTPVTSMQIDKDKALLNQWLPLYEPGDSIMFVLEDVWGITSEGKKPENEVFYNRF